MKLLEIGSSSKSRIVPGSLPTCLIEVANLDDIARLIIDNDEA
jgi:hypothetical protein